MKTLGIVDLLVLAYLLSGTKSTRIFVVRCLFFKLSGSALIGAFRGIKKIYTSFISELFLLHIGGSAFA